MFKHEDTPMPRLLVHFASSTEAPTGEAGEGLSPTPWEEMNAAMGWPPPDRHHATSLEGATGVLLAG